MNLSKSIFYICIAVAFAIASTGCTSRQRTIRPPMVGPAGPAGKDAAPCTLTNVSNGVEITCGSSTAVVANGVNGVDGKNGKDGSNGVGLNGRDGKDGVDGKDGIGLNGRDGVNGRDGANGKSMATYTRVATSQECPNGFGEVLETWVDLNDNGTYESSADRSFSSFVFCDSEGQTYLCHYPHTNPSKRHTLYVPDSEVREHLAHGDTFGECN